jgi:GNAT superfamily N-acetyltransferase
MNLEIREVKGRRDLRIFIHLPARIHKDHTNWVPPVYMDEWTFHNPKKNPAFQHSDTIRLLAFKDERAVGRIMGVINYKYNEAHNERDARFAFLETYNDPDVAAKLLQKIEDWAIEKGMEKLIGPLAFSDKDPQGFLVEGFDEPVVITTNCNFPYIVDIVQNYGFTKKTDLVAYKLTVPETMPEFYLKIRERALNNNSGIALFQPVKKSELRKLVIPVFDLVNETFRDIYGFSEVSLNEMKDFAKRYLPILDPRFLKVLFNEKRELIGFVLGIPEISNGIKKSKGYILPFGIFQILRSQKRSKQLTLLLGAIHPSYRNAGLDTILGVSMFETCKQAGIEWMDSHLELETNTKVRAEMEKMGGKVYKRFRIFEKAL